MNTIVTGSPIEGHIIAVFLKAQMTTAAFLAGTPIFRSLLFIALAWVVLQQILQIGMNHHQARQAGVTIVYRVGMAALALGLLNQANTGVVFASVDGPWNGYARVKSDLRYAATLNGGPPSLWAYGMLFEALDAVAQTSANAVAEGFSDPTLNRDPLFLTQQLARMAAFTLSPNREREFVTLIRQCGDPDTGKITGSAATSIRETLDLALPGCQDLWDRFRVNAGSDGLKLLEQYSPTVRDQLLKQIQARYPSIAANELGYIAFAWAIDRAAMDLRRASREAAKEQRSVPAASAPEGGAAGATATLGPDLGDRWLQRYAFVNSVDSYAPGADDPALAGWTMLSRQLAGVAPYIPVARGYIQGLLAILFVFALYSLGFGTWRFMRMWFMAEATICLYKPVALVGYKAATYFFLEDRVARALTASSQDGLIIGGARILQDQLSSIQTVYVAFELGAFFIFCIGAVRVFQPLAHLSMNFGNMAASMATGAGNMMALGLGAQPGAINGVPAGASAPAPAARGFTDRPANRGAESSATAGAGTGFQAPPTPAPSTWSDPA
jgi:hypothetical protein